MTDAMLQRSCVIASRDERRAAPKADRAPRTSQGPVPVPGGRSAYPPAGGLT